MSAKHNPDVYRCGECPNSDLVFKWASHLPYSHLDLARLEKTSLEKAGFAIKAINRWNAFVRAVERNEVLIKLYEDRVCPKIGGKRND